MDADAPRGLLRAFAQLKDPRVNRTKRHSLPDVLAIAICAIICGADGWAQVARFGRCKVKWFRTFLELPNGIPSHDTFGRVFAALDPAAFEECFMKWVNALATASAGRLIAIDGKTIRRSLDMAGGKAAIYMVNAWCEANHMVLGQLATDAKSNEITAIPELMKLLDLKDAVVTIDAAGCQKKIARQIVDQGGHYILQLKGNQGGLHDETVMLFDQCLTDDCHGIAYSTATTIDKGHGRIEERRIWATSDVNWFAEKGKWKNLRTLIRVQSKRTVGQETSARVPLLHHRPAGRQCFGVAVVHPWPLGRGEQTALVPGYQLPEGRPPHPQRARCRKLRPPLPHRAESAQGRENQ
jgi:predicted transposase YbfD/YdcC